MKRLRAFLLLISTVAFVHAAQAAGEHSGGHGKMPGHNMGGSGAAMQDASRAGMPAKAAQATRTIDLDMALARPDPSTIAVEERDASQAFVPLAQLGARFVQDAYDRDRKREIEEQDNAVWDDRYGQITGRMRGYENF